MSVSPNQDGRCTHCVIPRTAAHATFNDDGVCDVCASAPPQSNMSEDKVRENAEALRKNIERIKEDGKNRPYDCVVGISGGRDSTYLLHELTRKHNLRCLAAYYRTPFTPEKCHQNVLRLTERLNTPLVNMNISQEVHQKIAREMVVLWAKTRKSVYANMACAECKIVNGEIFHIAKKNKAKWVVYGSNAVESFGGASWRRTSDGQSEGAADRRFSFSRQMSRMLKIAQKGTELLVLSPALWKYLWLMFRGSILYLSPDTPYLKLRYHSIHVLHYFYLAGWTEAGCENALKEVGWELPYGSGTSWRADCNYAAFKDYLFQETVGTTYYDSLLSNMIRNGMITREEAMRRLEVEAGVFPEKVKAAMDILDLPEGLSLPTLSTNDER
ncbi:MAG: hypothetical protein JW818_15305 [Pirellulales bacterium]|nr:hypothetical protein [Pirellulales bacterium]